MAADDLVVQEARAPEAMVTLNITSDNTGRLTLLGMNLHMTDLSSRQIMDSYLFSWKKKISTISEVFTLVSLSLIDKKSVFDWVRLVPCVTRSSTAMVLTT